MTDDLDFKALWLEERAERQALTKALIDLKQQQTPPAPKRPEPAPDAADTEPPAPRLPKRVVQSLGKLEAQLKAARPDLSDEVIKAEAMQLAAEVFPDGF